MHKKRHANKKKKKEKKNKKEVKECTHAHPYTYT
jgi:hypothetical protein